MKTERRMSVTDLEVRDEGSTVTLSGYASTFNEPYSMGWYEEKVDPAAFKRTLTRNPDVRLLINHDGLPLARTKSGTLRLSSDERGLKVEADLDPTDPDTARLLPKMRRGDLNQMSFGFRTIADEWEDQMSKRTLRELDLNDGDVSVVTYPANPATVACVRANSVQTEALASALSALEKRSAPEEEVADVLVRALRFYKPDVLVEDRAVSDAPWDGSASRFTPEQWKASCILHLDDSDNKSSHKLPIREPNGTLSRAAVHAAAARINQVDAPAEKIASAKAALRGAYKQLGEDAPDSVRESDADTESATDVTPETPETSAERNRALAEQEERLRLADAL